MHGRPLNIVVAADSVAATRKVAQEGIRGWGQALEELLTDESITVKNTAKDSATTHWYFENRLPVVLNSLRPGDLFLIGFGVCDQAIIRPDLYVTPREFREYVNIYVDSLRSRDFVPVLVTQMARHIFTEDGVLSTPGTDYSDEMRRVARERGVPLVDLQRRAGEVLTAWGPELSRGFFRWYDAGELPQYPDGMIDTLHLSPQGARIAAQCVAEGLRELGLLPCPAVSLARDQERSQPRKRALTIAGYEAIWQNLPTAPPSLDAPSIKSPGAGGDVGPTLRLSGIAQTGTTHLLFFEGATPDGPVIGGTGIGENGQWMWRRVTSWPDGDHQVSVVAVSEDSHSVAITVRFTVRSRTEAPVVTGPVPHSLNGPRAVFKGASQPGTRKIVAMTDDGRWLGESEVVPDGTWKFCLPHNWRSGAHVIEFTAVGAGGVSPATVLPFEVLTVPDDNWLKQDPTAWHHCVPGNPCAHMKRDRPKAIENLRE